MEILKVKDLTYTYRGQSCPAFSCGGFSVGAGELVLVCGATGSGKTTLLRALLPSLGGGTVTGSVLLNGEPMTESAAVGYVAQDTSVSLTDGVISELSFTVPSSPRAVAEAAARFGLDRLAQRKTDSLSGGERQLLALAAATVSQPQLLLLDEPTSRLDPIAAAAFTDALLRYLRETGAAAVITEHRTEEFLPYADTVIAVRNGKAVFCGNVSQAVCFAKNETWFAEYLPAPVRLHIALGLNGEPPLTVAAARRKLERFSGRAYRKAPEQSIRGEKLLELSGVCFGYGKKADDVLRGVDLTLCRGEILCVLGGNGAGKSTLLRVAAGLERPYRGKVKSYGSGVVMLPQNIRSVFLHDSVQEELKGTGDLPVYDFSDKLNRHPFDLSGGEAQLLALRVALSAKPGLLLLDEPARGLDPDGKAALACALRQLADAGTGILVITHDPDFCAFCSDRCDLLFDGRLTGSTDTRGFLLGNSYYTTPARRMARGIIEGAVTVDEIAEVCREQQ